MHSPTLPSLIPPFPLKIVPFIPAMESGGELWGSAVSWGSAVWGGVPGDIDFGAF